MANKSSTITLPKWAREIIPRPQKYLKDSLKNLAFLKMKEYERQIQTFKQRYKISFNQFEKKVKSLKKENFKLWDDYLVWKGLNDAYQKWFKRYKEI